MCDRRSGDDVDKPTTLELIKMLDNEKIIKLRKSKALLEIQNM